MMLDLLDMRAEQSRPARGRLQIFLTTNVPETPFGALRDCWIDLSYEHLSQEHQNYGCSSAFLPDLSIV
jgi:hypothetical protein